MTASAEFWAQADLLPVQPSEGGTSKPYLAAQRVREIARRVDRLARSVTLEYEKDTLRRSRVLETISVTKRNKAALEFLKTENEYIAPKLHELTSATRTLLKHTQSLPTVANLPQDSAENTLRAISAILTANGFLAGARRPAKSRATLHEESRATTAVHAIRAIIDARPRTEEEGNASKK